MASRSFRSRPLPRVELVLPSRTSWHQSHVWIRPRPTDVSMELYLSRVTRYRSECLISLKWSEDEAMWRERGRFPPVSVYMVSVPIRLCWTINTNFGCGVRGHTDGRRNTAYTRGFTPCFMIVLWLFLFCEDMVECDRWKWTWKSAIIPWSPVKKKKVFDYLEV